MVRSYRELIVWQQGMKLAKQCHSLSKTFPKDELYGLVSQLRRAAVSIPTNIAEGRGRGTRKDFVQFLRIANGSLAEVETLLMLAGDFGYCGEEETQMVLEKTSQIGKMLNSMIRQLLAPAEAAPLKAESRKLEAESCEAL